MCDAESVGLNEWWGKKGWETIISALSTLSQSKRLTKKMFSFRIKIKEFFGKFSLKQKEMQKGNKMPKTYFRTEYS